MIMGLPKGLARNIPVDQLSLLFLFQFQKYFCNYRIKDSEFKIRVLIIENIHIQLRVFIKKKSDAVDLRKQSFAIGPPGFKICFIP